MIWLLYSLAMPAANGVLLILAILLGNAIDTLARR